MKSYEILQTVSGERLISFIIWDTITIITRYVYYERWSKSAWTGALEIAELHFGKKQEMHTRSESISKFRRKILRKKNNDGFLQNQRYRNYEVRGPQFWLLSLCIRRNSNLFCARALLSSLTSCFVVYNCLFPWNRWNVVTRGVVDGRFISRSTVCMNNFVYQMRGVSIEMQKTDTLLSNMQRLELEISSTGHPLFTVCGYSINDVILYLLYPGIP